MKKKVLMLVVLVLGLVGIILGVTYAFFNYTREGETENVLTSGSIVFHYDEITEQGRGINLIDALPADDNEQEKENNSYFEFSIKANTTVAEIPYTVALRLSEDSNLDLSAVRIYLTEVEGNSESEVVYTTLSELENKVFIRDFSEKVLYKTVVPVDGNEYEKVYRLRMWIDEDIDYSSGNYNNKRVKLTVNVYTNDGTQLTEENITSKEDTRIKMITANNRYLVEESEEEDIDYEVVVPNEVSNISFDVITRNISADAEVEALGTSLTYNENNIKRLTQESNFNLSVRENYFRVKVKSADNSERKNYILKVDREYSKDNSLISM